MSWNYRVVKDKGNYGIYEVYYHDRGKYKNQIYATSSKPCGLHYCAKKAELKSELKHMLAAFKKPILSMARLNRTWAKRAQKQAKN